MVDPQSQTLTVMLLAGVVMELCMPTAVLCGGAGEPACSKYINVLRRAEEQRSDERANAPETFFGRRGTPGFTTSCIVAVVVLFVVGQLSIKHG